MKHRLFIGEFSVQVVFKPEAKVEGTIVYGSYEPTCNVIEVDSDYDTQVQARALWHEVTHALVALRLGKSIWQVPVSEMEELYVRTFEGMQDVLLDRRNDWFRKLVMKRAPGGGQ